MISEFRKFLYPATFQKKIEVAPDIFEFQFKINEDFVFSPGQYIWLQLLNMKEEDKRGDRRAMSILNLPNKENIISVLFKIGESGFKKAAKDLKEGDSVNILGPFGVSFCIPENNQLDLCFISGGVGLAPFLSLIKDATVKKLKRKLSLVAVFNSKEDAILVEEIKELEKKNKNFKSFILYKNPESDFFDKNFRVSENMFYVAGPQGFVDFIYENLERMGVQNDLMIFENYYPTDNYSGDLHNFFKKEKQDNIGKSDILLSAIESSSHHIVITDKNGLVLFANSAAQKITGYTFEEMEGNTPRLWGGLMSKEFYKKLWHSKLNGEIIDAEIVNRRKNGEIYHVISHISPIKDKDSNIIGYIGTEEDISYIKKQEEELKKTNRELERFNKVTVERELKMIELKKRIKELEAKTYEKKS